jgi:multiple sugar transport system permease protein
MNAVTRKTAAKGFLMPRKRSLGRYQALMAYLFISPSMFLFAVFVLLPALMAFYLSFTNYDILRPAEWIGLDNYERLKNDRLFWTSLENIVEYAAFFVPLIIVSSLSLALALNRKRPGMKLFRMIYYLPVITSPVAASVVWRWILNKQYGLLNELLGYVGIEGPAWLSQTDTAMTAIILVTLWQGIGSNMVIYLAGLQGIPKQLYEAAMLDGANAWGCFRHITWPSLRATTFLISTMALISSFQLFDQAYVLTKGGPGHATRTPVYHIYEMGFNRLRMGYASALSLVLFLIIFVVTLVNLRLNREQNLLTE